MPTYQYRCTECGTELEVVQKFTDDALTVCPECEGRLRKVFNAVGVVFKGPGFYATDNRPKSKSTSASETRKPEKSDSKHKSEHKKSEHKKSEHKKSEHSSTPSSSTGPASTS